MPKRRKSRTAKQRKRLKLENASQLELSIGVPEYQESTCQVPVGEHSIWNAVKDGEIAIGAAAVYLVMNRYSNWSTGWTHHLSYSEIRKKMGDSMPHSTIIHHSQTLEAKGWILEKNRHKGKGNTYRLVHHNCDPLDAPRDKDGLPKKCAMPIGGGSVYEKMENGEIGWQAFVYWNLLKMLSNWTTGVVSLTYAQTQEWLKIGSQTVSRIKKEIERANLCQRLSSCFQAFVCQLFPKPYPNRRRRRRENPKSMKLIDGFYYSFNELWRVSRETGEIQTKLEGSNRWRHANEKELELVNVKILKDFKPIIELACSPFMQRMRSEAAV